MNTTVSSPILTPSDFDAVLFDLDGVITDTAALHIAAWKELFDTYLKARATHAHRCFRPFDTDTDYRQYVDGKVRDDGITSFLSSRGITLPYGSPTDAPEHETICGLGKKKNCIFHHLLQTRGVTVFASSVAFIHQLRACGLCTVVEDSIAGVQAARAGHFGLVIAVARADNRADLQEHGADIVVADLEEIAVLSHT